MATMDAGFRDTTFVVLDVELRRQPGGPAPVGLAAMAVHGADWRVLWRVHSPITDAAPLSSSPGPPAPADSGEGSAGAAVAGIERRLTDGPHKVVAATGLVEAALLRAERAGCPNLASLVMWDALRLAQVVCPGVQGGLEELGRHLGVPVGPGPRAATQEVWATAQVFRRAIERGAASGRWSTLWEVEKLAGKAPPPVEAEFFAPTVVQDQLFE